MGRSTQTYDILTRIAVGNGALVYRAMDKVTHRQVALKLLVQDGNVDHRFHADELLADSAKLKQITGAHVCQLLDAFTDDDGPVLVYEFAQGTGGAELPAQRKLDAAHALDIAAQLISALRSGERQKCPHGDVKPSNLIFMELADKRPFTLVLDWALTAYRSAVADDTLPYLAPERLDGAAASHRADLFSAGATIFFLCTGKTLVAGTKRAELHASWEKVRPAVLAELRPDLPAKFVQWLCTLLELAPEKRPESAVDALAALAALNPPPPPVPPESFRPRPASKIAALPIASGIVKPPPPAQAKPESAIRKPPPASSSASAPVKPPAKPGTAPVKKSHVAMTVGLFVSFVALIGGCVWFFLFRKSQDKTPDDDYATRPRSTAPARTPAPSVGQDIGKKITPPPQTPTPAAKPAPPPKSKPKPTPKPKPKPTPTPAAPVTVPEPPPPAK